MVLPILYSFRRCPYAIRARLAIIVSGKRVELREVILRDKPRALLDASPKGTVPVLVLPDGSVIDQSLDIVHWATNDAEGDRGLLATNDGAFKHHLDRYKYAERHDADRLDHRAAATAILERLDATLNIRDRLGGEGDIITDLSIMPFVRQFAETDRAYFDGLPLAALQRWLIQHLASNAFALAMVRIPQWHPNHAPVLFPIGSATTS